MAGRPKDPWLRDVETIQVATGEWVQWMTFEGGTLREQRAERARQQQIRDRALIYRCQDENRRLLAGDPLAMYGDYLPDPMFVPGRPDGPC